MSARRFLVLAALGCVVAAVAAGAGTASGGKASDVVVIKAVTSVPKVVVNRFIQDDLRWDHDVYKVKQGGTLHIVNDAADEGPHTFTVVRYTDLPKTGKQMLDCNICGKLAKAHGANPNSDAPPKYQYLEDGVGQKTPPKVDKPGDSGVTGSGKKGESINLKVTASKGTRLYFMCLIHPWMQAQVDVT